MMWNDALFRMINETRRLAAQDVESYATQSGWLAEIIDQGFFATQLFAIRRLLESAASRPHRQVISLRRLLDDITANIHLFTRENFIAHDALPYDIQAAQEKFGKAGLHTGFFTSQHLGPTDYSSAERAHERFDRMSGADPNCRARRDLLGSRPIDEMKVRIAAAPFQDAVSLANKRIAHSPDPSSLPATGIPTLTFSQLWECQRTIVEVTAFVSTYVLQDGSHGVVPIPQLSMFEHWDRPFMPADAGATRTSCGTARRRNVRSGPTRTCGLSSKTSFRRHFSDDLMIVPDATKDSRFDCNPLVHENPKLRFYAGVLLKTPQGLPIGTMCVLDYQPRHLDEQQIRTLKILARQAMTQLELRRSLAQTRALETRHRQIVNSATDFAFVTTDLDGTISFWNVGAARIIGWSEEEVIGQPADLFFTPEDKAHGVPEREMSITREEGRSTDERWHLRKDGERFWASGKMMRLTDDPDRHVGYLKILRDAIGRRKAEEQKAILTRELSHRMKNTFAMVQSIVA